MATDLEKALHVECKRLAEKVRVLEGEGRTEFHRIVGSLSEQLDKARATAAASETMLRRHCERNAGACHYDHHGECQEHWGVPDKFISPGIRPDDAPRGECAHVMECRILGLDPLTGEVVPVEPSP